MKFKNETTGEILSHEEFVSFVWDEAERQFNDCHDNENWNDLYGDEKLSIFCEQYEHQLSERDWCEDTGKEQLGLFKNAITDETLSCKEFVSFVWSEAVRQFNDCHKNETWCDLNRDEQISIYCEQYQHQLSDRDWRELYKKEAIETASLGSKYLQKFKDLAERYGFKVEQEHERYNLCAKTAFDHEWIRWISYSPNEDKIYLHGNTDHLNIWLCDSRKDFTPEKCLQFVNDLNEIFELAGENKILMKQLIDPEDWQVIANIRDAFEDPRYMGTEMVN